MSAAASNQPSSSWGVGLGPKFVEVRRSYDNQTSRCKAMLKRLKTLQLQEMEDFEEKQFDNVIKTFTDKHGVKLKDAEVPDFLQKRKLPVPPPDVFEEEDFFEQVDLTGPSIDSKMGLAEVEEVSQMIKSGMKECLFSTFPLGKDDDETDSCSEPEDEVEATASYKHTIEGKDKEKNLVYLSSEHNPGYKWAKQKVDLLSKFTWLKDQRRVLDQKFVQQERLLEYIEKHKPPFKFDDKIKVTKPITIGTESSVSQVKMYSDGRERLMTSSSEKLNQKSVWVAKEPRCYSTGDEAFKRLQLHIIDNRDPTCVARRCIPLMKPYRHRKVLQIGGIHNVVGKPVKQPTVYCSCFGRTELCAICSGRSEKIKRVRPGAMDRGEVTALLDHNYHKVLSSSQKPTRLLTEAALKTSPWSKNKRASEKDEVSATPTTTTGRKKKHDDDKDKRHGGRMFLPAKFCRPFVEYEFVEQPPLDPEYYEQTDQQYTYEEGSPSKSAKSDKRSRKRRIPRLNFSDDEDEDDEEETEFSWTQKKAPLTPVDSAMKKRRTGMDEKYDIDHIVIPYSIAAATRVEKIEYKEIDIPSWKINAIEPMKRPDPPKAARSTRTSRSKSITSILKQQEEEEDVSLPAVLARHERSEEEERIRFRPIKASSSRRSRKSESKPDFPGDISEHGMDDSEITVLREEQDTPCITAADANLAVTTLKVGVAGTPRRRTTSICRVEESDEEDEEINPWEPRKFPLSKTEYERMSKEMEEAYNQANEEDEFNPTTQYNQAPEEEYKERSSDDQEKDDDEWFQ